MDSKRGSSDCDSGEVEDIVFVSCCGCGRGLSLLVVPKFLQYIQLGNAGKSSKGFSSFLDSLSAEQEGHAGNYGVQVVLTKKLGPYCA